MPELRLPDRPGLSLFAALHAELAAAPLGAVVADLQSVLADRLRTVRHGDAAALSAALDSLPDVRPASLDFSARAVRVGEAGQLDPAAMAGLEDALQALHPWRKGPFDVFGLRVDSEWRSDLKWERVAAAASPFAGRRVLDVGCGNGYYAWRMLGAGARFVLGVDPALRALAQFRALRRFVPSAPACVLPLGGEELPAGMHCFDTVLSMGVLYHRRDPLTHLAELADALQPGGELILETLVLPDAGHAVLEPRGRYAKMRNVWAIPSCPTLLDWVARAGFAAARIADCTPTTTAEQRRTAWMRFESLAEFLDPGDPSRTIEGHPAPLRALLVATWPGTG